MLTSFCSLCSGLDHGPPSTSSGSVPSILLPPPRRPTCNQLRTRLRCWISMTSTLSFSVRFFLTSLQLSLPRLEADLDASHFPFLFTQLLPPTSPSPFTSSSPLLQPQYRSFPPSSSPFLTLRSHSQASKSPSLPPSLALPRSPFPRLRDQPQLRRQNSLRWRRRSAVGVGRGEVGGGETE